MYTTMAFNSVMDTTSAQFSNLIIGMFRTGNQLQKDMVNLMLSPFRAEVSTTRQMMKMTFDMMLQSAEVFGFFMPGRDNRLAWHVLRNKLQAFDLFEYVDLVLELPKEPDLPLTELVKKASALGPYFAVWATEGLGYYYAETFWEQKGTPWNLLTDDKVAALPLRSLISLHTGMGLSIADRLLRTVKPQSSVSETRNVLQQLVTLCENNSRDGYAEIAIESLGLVARNLYPWRIPTIDQQLSQIDMKLVAYFWHGVGRALCFVPTNSMPSRDIAGRALKMSQREPPHKLGRLNTLSGLVWALTLVNMRQPEIMEVFLKRHSDQLSESSAFSNGIVSAVLIWYDSAPDDPYLPAFCEHQPDFAENGLVKIWNSQVKKPCQEALQHYYGVLKEQTGWGELFRYQSLPELVNRLKRESGS